MHRNHRNINKSYKFDVLKPKEIADGIVDHTAEEQATNTGSILKQVVRQAT